LHYLPLISRLQHADISPPSPAIARDLPLSPAISRDLPAISRLQHADLLASSDCLDPDLDERDHGCFHTLIDRNTGIVLVRNTSTAFAAMGEWQARTAGAFQAWETDQTAFDDLLRGRGQGHRRSMTPQQRAERLRYKVEWCGLPKGTLDRDSMGTLASLGPLHTNGSRQLWEVCIPDVARALRFGLLPLPLSPNPNRNPNPKPNHKPNPNPKPNPDPDPSPNPNQVCCRSLASRTATPSSCSCCTP